jgi:hypothetical protein
MTGARARYPDAERDLDLRWWDAANDLTVAQICLQTNPPLREPRTPAASWRLPGFLNPRRDGAVVPRPLTPPGLRVLAVETDEESELDHEARRLLARVDGPARAYPRTVSARAISASRAMICSATSADHRRIRSQSRKSPAVA